MYANTGSNASWAYNNEDDPYDSYNSPSLASDSDSAQELRDLEELLYSHIHYEPNLQYMSGSPDDHSCSDVHITQVNDGVLDRLDVSDSATKQEPVTSNSADDEVVIIDVIPPQDEVGCDSAAASSSFSEQLKRKAVMCKISHVADEIKMKSKKIDASDSPSGIAAESTTAKNRCTLNNAAAAGRSFSKKKVCQPDRRDLGKKKLKVQHKSGISHTAAAAEAAKPVVVDSESDSSDIFCCDLSSDELSSAEADDIKLSNINVDLPQTSDVAALTDVLNSLPGIVCFH